MISKRPHSPAYVVAADFLRARQWAGNCIGAASHGVRPPPYPADVDDDILEQLLKYERCAAWLLEGLTATGFIRSLPASTVEIVRTAAMKETQGTMRALLDARELSSIATRLGVPVIVLKGGVRAITGASPPLPLVDIDILVPAGRVDEIVSELEKTGFGTARQKLAHHQGLEPANDHLSVEVHWSLLGDGLPVEPGVWDRKEAIENAPGLFSLGKTDNLVHVVRHALENHRQRPVSLRDTILAGTIVDTCSVHEQANAREQIHAATRSTEAQAIVSYGTYLVGRDPEIEPDPFVDQCAAFYATVAVGPRLPRFVASAGALSFVSDVAIGRAGFLRAARDSLKWQGTAVEPISRFEERVPGVVRPLVGLAHLAYYAVASAVAIPLVRRAKDKALDDFRQRST